MVGNKRYFATNIAEKNSQTNLLAADE